MLILLISSGIQGAFPTSRQAWREVRDHTEREADTRRAYLEALQESVVRVLQEVGTVQSRIRGRIKEDLERTTDVSVTRFMLYGELCLPAFVIDVHRTS
jgi:hypothetical protein